MTAPVARIAARLKGGLIFIHRWMGVFFCLLFLMWFASGIAMMYWSYPEITAADRLNREPPLDPSRIGRTPQEAYATLKIAQPPDAVRLETFDGRPAYRFEVGGDESIVYADTGESQGDCSSAIARRLAATWTRQPGALAKAEINTEADQWTVSEQFSALRPLRKYSWPDGQQVYVSTVTCGVVQYTTHASRMGAYVSAIPHWLYFTPLRKHGEQWSRIVIGASALGTLAASLGLAIGIWVYSPSKRYRHGKEASSMPYVGQKRWHMMLGLTFGTLACTWAFSGMLSMDPFPALQSGDSDIGAADLAQALRGTPASLTAFAAKPPRQALIDTGSTFGAKQLDFIFVMGEPVYLAAAAPNETLIVPMKGPPRAGFDRQAIVNTLRSAARPYDITQVRLVTQYEAYYLDRHHALPLPVIFVRLNDPERSMYYVDPKTAQIVEGYNAHSRWNRWLYHGLHSMNLPWLYRHRPAWDFTVLILLLGGASLCVTSLVLAWRVVRRKVMRNIPRLS